MEEMIVDPINSYVLLKRTKEVKNLLSWLTKNVSDKTRPKLNGFLIKENARTIAATNGYVMIVVHLFNSLTDKNEQVLADAFYQLNGATKDLIILETVSIEVDHFPNYQPLFGRKSISYAKEHSFTRSIFNRLVDQNFDVFTIEAREKNYPVLLKLKPTVLPAGDYLAAIMPCLQTEEDALPKLLEKMGFGMEVV